MLRRFVVFKIIKDIFYAVSTKATALAVGLMAFASVASVHAETNPVTVTKDNRILHSTIFDTEGHYTTYTRADSDSFYVFGDEGKDVPTDTISAKAFDKVYEKAKVREITAHADDAAHVCMSDGEPDLVTVYGNESSDNLYQDMVTLNRIPGTERFEIYNNKEDVPQGNISEKGVDRILDAISLENVHVHEKENDAESGGYHGAEEPANIASTARQQKLLDKCNNLEKVFQYYSYYSIDKYNNSNVDMALSRAVSSSLAVGYTSLPTSLELDFIESRDCKKLDRIRKKLFKKRRKLAKSMERKGMFENPRYF
jgi:hypothetical protein